MTKKYYFFFFIILVLFCLWFNVFEYFDYTNTNTSQQKNNINKSIVGNNNECVCFFAYFEKNEKYKGNMIYFLENGILPQIDYYIIVNGTSTIDFPDKPNISIIYRENKYYDFGAYNYCINKYINKEYNYYVFLNTSIKGPYLSNPNTTWFNEFVKLFNTPDVKLVGTSINIWSDGFFWPREKLEEIYGKKQCFTHIQSMFFMLNNEGFNFLKNKGFFSEDYEDFYEVILYKELGLTQLILANGWNINSILEKYRDQDYRTLQTNINTSGEDPYYIGGYFGGTIQPLDIIFFKTNRFEVEGVNT
jgi:hypothetical protein